MRNILVDCDFFRVSRNHLISLRHIKTYKKDKSEVVMVNGEAIEVSRRKRKEFIDAMENLRDFI
ncbi:MAG: LytTR family transcriptional regulator DNA-binding domain-containing protein [Flavobacteriales bacterium]